MRTSGGWFSGNREPRHVCGPRRRRGGTQRTPAGRSGAEAQPPGCGSPSRRPDACRSPVGASTDSGGRRRGDEMAHERARTRERACSVVTPRRRSGSRAAAWLGPAAIGCLLLQAAAATAGQAETAPGVEAPPAAARSSAAPVEAMLNRYCITCHSDGGYAAGRVPVSLQPLDPANVGAHAGAWEQVALKLRSRMMPPVGRPRPDEAAYDSGGDLARGRARPRRRRRPEPRPHDRASAQPGRVRQRRSATSSGSRSIPRRCCRPTTTTRASTTSPTCCRCRRPSWSATCTRRGR